MSFCRLLFFFSKLMFSKTKQKSFRNTIRVLKSWDPDQGRRSVGPDLVPNCLQRLSADDTSWFRVQSEDSQSLAWNNKKHRKILKCIIIMYSAVK